jgi:hypothetical protein
MKHLTKGRNAAKTAQDVWHFRVEMTTRLNFSLFLRRRLDVALIPVALILSLLLPPLRGTPFPAF